jgi:hypothetical protein
MLRLDPVDGLIAISLGEDLQSLLHLVYRGDHPLGRIPLMD